MFKCAAVNDFLWIELGEVRLVNMKFENRVSLGGDECLKVAFVVRAIVLKVNDGLLT